MANAGAPVVRAPAPDLTPGPERRLPGVLAGRLSGFGMRRPAEIGCTLASFVLESVSTQEYSFDADDFASRVAWTYGADSATDVRAFLAAPRRTDQEETA